MVMDTKLGRMVAHLDGLLLIKSHNPLITWFCKNTRQTKGIISLLPAFRGLLTIKLYNTLITCSCKVTWQTKIIISPLPVYLWPPKLADLDGFLLIKSHDPLIMWPCKVMWKTKTLSATRVSIATKLGLS